MVVCWPLPLDCFQIFLTFFTKHSKDWGARNAGNEIPSLSFYARVKEQCSQLTMGIFRIVLVLQETGVSNVMLSFIVFVKKNKSWDHCHKSKVNYFIGGGLINFEIKACMGLFGRELQMFFLQNMDCAEFGPKVVVIVSCIKMQISYWPFWNVRLLIGIFNIASNRRILFLLLSCRLVFKQILCISV